MYVLKHDAVQIEGSNGFEDYDLCFVGISGVGPLKLPRSPRSEVVLTGAYVDESQGSRARVGQAVSSVVADYREIEALNERRTMDFVVAHVAPWVAHQ